MYGYRDEYDFFRTNENELEPNGPVIAVGLIHAALLVLLLPVICVLLLISFERWRTEKLTREGQLRAPFPHRTRETPREQPGTWRLRWPQRNRTCRKQNAL